MKSAIDEVLAAEQGLVKAMSECRRRAEQIVGEAQDRARAIQHRAEQRIAAVHQHSRDLIAEHSHSQPGPAVGGLDPRQLKAGILKVAKQLTEPGSDAGRG